MKNFCELELSPELALAITEMGFKVPTPIQAQALPLLFQGPTDFLGLAATGTGKTLAFGIPLLEDIDPADRTTQGIVLCPTRELAIQVSEQLILLGKHKRIHAQVIYGGAGYSEQIRGLKRGAHLVVATPGRLIDHLKKGNLSLERVSTVVLDEADEMISMGFKDELEFVLAHVPSNKCRKWLFAATMSPELQRVAARFLQNPKLVQVNRVQMLPGTVKQVYYSVREKNKPKGISKLIEMADEFYGLVFCQTKALVVELTQYLRMHGHSVDCLHGDKSQQERERTLTLFREKKVNILVCSDVAARGLDVKDLTHVINYSLPPEFESYVHRIGRTGRSGRPGLALSLVAPSQMGQIDLIEKRTKTKMEAGIFPTRKEISTKKLALLIPRFAKGLGHEKAREVLDSSWVEALESMTKTDIAARFLALAFPDLFDDTEKAEEIGLGEKEEKVRRPRFVKRYHQQPRKPWRNNGHHGRR